VIHKIFAFKLNGLLQHKCPDPVLKGFKQLNNVFFLTYIVKAEIIYFVYLTGTRQNV